MFDSPRDAVHHAFAHLYGSERESNAPATPIVDIKCALVVYMRARAQMSVAGGDARAAHHVMFASERVLGQPNKVARNVVHIMGALTLGEVLMRVDAGELSEELLQSAVDSAGRRCMGESSLLFAKAHARAHTLPLTHTHTEVHAHTTHGAHALPSPSYLSLFTWMYLCVVLTISALPFPQMPALSSCLRCPPVQLWCTAVCTIRCSSSHGVCCLTRVSSLTHG